MCVQGVTDDNVDIKDFSAAEGGGETAPGWLASPSYTVLSKALSTFAELSERRRAASVLSHHFAGQFYLKRNRQFEISNH